ncbi:glycosyltransferase [Flagellatimonas centrodinii]|uniref:glycosyltransferase n=1 Tax=Flagellatimonas centrodinii TaxID=2806210 RepID=UPI001FEFAE64|nr:glycosyltransferase [Flagellatimonas centrodinii]ULQ46701.1 glycosyltransferase [Flagellatimonas centrodinii]
MISPVKGRRISVLLPDLRPGGAERLHVNLARDWVERGLDVDFVLRNAVGELLDELPIGVRVVDLAVPRVRGLLRPLTRYLRREKPNGLLAAMWPLTVIAPVAGRMSGFRGRVVISEHSPLSVAYASKGLLHRVLLRSSQWFAYGLADACVAVSCGVADDLAALSGRPRQRFEVIGNPVALGGAINACPAPAALAGVARPLFLTVGSLKAVKRHDRLIDAFALVASRVGGTLCILGEGAERASLEAQVKSLGLKGRVLLPGYSANVGAWYAGADQFVLSSDYEGFGNVLVEAMEYGLPIVSTDCVSGPREVLHGGAFGRLVPVNDPSALADAMVDMLRTPINKPALLARAREFSVDVVSARYLDVLMPGWWGKETA